MCRPSRLTKRGDLEVVLIASRACGGRGSVGMRGAGRAGSPCEPVAACRRTALLGFVSPVSFRLRRQGWKYCRRNGGPCVRQNRVVLAVVATVKSFAKMRASPTGQTASSNSRDEGGQRKVRLPGDHGIRRPTIAQGRPRVRHHLYAAVRFFLRVHFAQRTAGASRHPAFPAPSWIRGREMKQSSGDQAARPKTHVCKRDVAGRAMPLRHTPSSRGAQRQNCVAILRRCDEAIQNPSAEAVWIASRSLSSGRASRGPGGSQ
jgi:hypothetical protein